MPETTGRAPARSLDETDCTCAKCGEVVLSTDMCAEVVLSTDMCAEVSDILHRAGDAGLAACEREGR